MTNSNDYQQAFNGSFVAILRWPQLDTLWQTVRSQQQAWWLYRPQQPLPQAAMNHDELDHFLHELDTQLHEEHDHDYCGIVYVDNPEQPTYIKVYDPSNLGVVCGISQGKPLPGWILSHLRPESLAESTPAPNKRRWWQGLLGKNP